MAGNTMANGATLVDFLLPDLGEEIEEADVLQVLVAVGDEVVLEQAILEIETEKATLDLPSSVAGVITAIHVRVGDTIRPGDAVITVDSAGAVPAATPPPATPSEPTAPQAEPQRQAVPPPVEPAPTPEPTPAPQVEPAPAPQPQTAAAAPLLAGEPDRRPVFASPSVRRFAREIGVEIQSVPGSGPGGRISEDDVKRHARNRSIAPPATTAAAEPAAAPLPDFAEFGPIEREPLSRLRRTIKRNMAASWREIPHVTLHHTADITDLDSVRHQYRERAEQAGGKLTVTAIMLKIVAAALRAHPRANSSLDAANNELILKRYVHLGVAVDTPRGLVVPVIRDVDRKNIIQIAVELTDVSARARSGDLTLEEFRGSSFTVTNLGGIGTGHFTPIIHHPNAAILGIGRSERRPVWDDEQELWVSRSIMPLSFAFDHRVMDGADGARFMSWISDAIRQPLVLALEG